MPALLAVDAARKRMKLMIQRAANADKLRVFVRPTGNCPEYVGFMPLFAQLLRNILRDPSGASNAIDRINLHNFHSYLEFNTAASKISLCGKGK